METTTVCTSGFEITQMGLSKESGIGHESDDSGGMGAPGGVTAREGKRPKAYPFALVLRLRVLQIVCGISSLVMGTVAFIEEQGEVNLGLGMPAGLVTVLAAGVSIQTSRGWSDYREPSCQLSLRWLGPTTAAGAVSGCLWTTALCLHLAVFGLCLPAIVSSGQMAAVGLLLALLSGFTLLAALATIHLDCTHDPD